MILEKEKKQMGKNKVLEQSDVEQPDIELVKRFLENQNPEMFDMKTQWIDINDPLERELYFRRIISKVPDPDACELTMSIMCVLLKGNGFNVLGYNGRHIFLEDGSKIETDTANSFISLYKGALITYHPKYKQFLVDYGIEDSFVKNYKKIYEHRDEISFETFDRNLYELLCQYAALTHSIGNFVLGPIGFNCSDSKSKAKLYSAKVWDSFDRMDLFLGKVASGETHDEWEKWYKVNMKKTYTDYFYLELKYGNDNEIVLSESTLVDLGAKDLHVRIATINELIKRRGLAMVTDLRRFMDECVWN
jgi:hypothetical protein